MHSQSDPYIKATKDTKTYRKPSKTEELPDVTKPNIDVTKPIAEDTKSILMANESLIEGKTIKLDILIIQQMLNLDFSNCVGT